MIEHHPQCISDLIHVKRRLHCENRVLRYARSDLKPARTASVIPARRVLARISKSDGATSRVGDLQAASITVSNRQSPIDLKIDRMVQ
jgi:hypothetical protein